MILFVTEQYAGAQYIHPLITKWKEDNLNNIKYEIIAKGGSVKYFQENSIEFFNAENITVNYIKNYLKTKKIRLIILSASGASIEALFISYAKYFGINTVSFIDTWTNYKNRFVHDGSKIYPNKILSIDSVCTKEMVQDGIPSKIIYEIGQPYLEYICKHKPPIGDKILLPMQPVKKIEGNKFGYDEYSFLNTSLKAIDLVGMSKEVYISIHPSSKLDDYCKKINNCYKGDGVNDVKKAHTILGMYSMQMIIGYLWERRVVSVQPCVKNYDPSPLSRWGLIPRVDNVKELASLIKKPPIKENLGEKMCKNIIGSVNRLDSFVRTYDD